MHLGTCLDNLPVSSLACMPHTHSNLCNHGKGSTEIDYSAHVEQNTPCPRYDEALDENQCIHNHVKQNPPQVGNYDYKSLDLGCGLGLSASDRAPSWDDGMAVVNDGMTVCALDGMAVGNDGMKECANQDKHAASTPPRGRTWTHTSL